MSEFPPRSGRYDATLDAARLAEPLKRWSGFGFWRGLSGIRFELIPIGKFRLPSAIFEEKAAASMQSDERLPYDEYNARLRYISEVRQHLRQAQMEAFDRHYNNCLLGHVADVIIAVIFAGLVAALLWTLGPYHPWTLTLLGLIGVKILFFFFSVRRLLNISKRTFQDELADFRLPWQDEHKAVQ